MNSRFNILLYLKIFTFLCIIYSLSSCKSKEIIQPIHPEIYKVNTCIAADDIAGLINLYHEITEHKDYAYLSIFCDFDMREYNYEKLLDLYNIAKEDSLLKEGFEIIIEEREDFIINELINKPIDEVAQYYLQHPQQHRFLDTFIEESLISNIDNMDYFELKSLSHSFKETQFFDKVDRKRKELKKKMSKQIKKDLSEYTKSESESLNYLELSIKTFLATHLYEKYPMIMEDIFENDLPKDYYNIESFANGIIDKYISNQAIEEFIRNEINKYSQEINNTRKEILSSVTFEDIPNNGYQFLFELRQRPLRIGCNSYTLYSISKIQNEKDRVGTALSVASFLGSFVPGGVILDAIDLGYGIRSAKKRSQKQIPYINSFTEDFRMRMENAAEYYTNEIMRAIRERYKKSQKEFSKIYYELY